MTEAFPEMRLRVLEVQKGEPGSKRRKRPLKDEMRPDLSNASDADSFTLIPIVGVKVVTID